MRRLRRPRSVYIAFEVFPRPKGASSHMAAMVSAMARSHSPVLLLCCGLPEMPSLQFEGDIVINRHKLRHPNLLRRTVEFSRFVSDSLTALEEHPALCVFRDPWGGLPALKSLPEAPSIFEVNGLPGWELPYTYPDLGINAALKAKIEDMERFCLGSVDAVVTVSQVTADALTACGVDPERIVVVPNSAPHFFFESPGGPCPIEDLSQGRWFGYFGSLHPWQGVEVLVEAWARIAEGFPDVRLLLVPGKRTAGFKDLIRIVRRRGISDRVLVHPPLPREDLAAVMRRMEFTCAPLAETLRNVVQGCCPVKIVESMAAGAPVLASNLAVSRALITHGIDGFLARPGNPRDWAQAIVRLLSDPGLRDRLAAGAKRTAAKCFTEGIMSDRLNYVFEMASEHRSRGRSCG
jgi:glycosyltransferase involved in cell wall biosynthesis